MTIDIDINQFVQRNRKFTADGKVATYIPELKYAPKDSLGFAVYDIKTNKIDKAGDYTYKFSIQSMAKIAILACAILDSGKSKAFSKVGLKPSSDPFNSILKLETMKDHRPLNPFINAGAITCVSLCNGDNAVDKFNRIHSLLENLTNNENLVVNEKIYLSESITGDNNRALAYFMKGSAILEENTDVKMILDVYFRLCSIEVDVIDLASLGAVLANNGVAPWNGVRYLSAELNNIICTIMFTCGMYDYSGEFAVMVGLPAKSGVSGGIVTSLKDKYGISVCGPALDEHGNSVAGIQLLKDFVKTISYKLF